MKRRAKTTGFSLIELLAVMAILLVVTAIALPAIQKINVTYQMDVAAHSTASLLQQARLQAVSSNQPAYAQYVAATIPNSVFVNGDPSVTHYVSGNPSVAFGSRITFQISGLPDHSQLDAYLGVAPPPAGSPSVQIGTVVGFNARGLPCLEGASPAVCKQLDAGGATPAFLWFLSDGNGSWGAITITPAGRIKGWRLANRDASLASCGYPACWQ
jgi:prepilin-type N-terminal cleavage/methylation domain-containing protein